MMEYFRLFFQYDRVVPYLDPVVFQEGIGLLFVHHIVRFVTVLKRVHELMVYESRTVSEDEALLLNSPISTIGEV